MVTAVVVAQRSTSLCKHQVARGLPDVYTSIMSLLAVTVAGFSNCQSWGLAQDRIMLSVPYNMLYIKSDIHLFVFCRI